MSDLSKIILSNLAYNDSFSRRVAPFLKTEYFESYTEKIVFKIISDFIREYNSTPSKDAILVCLDKKTDLNEETYKTCRNLVESMSVDEKTDQTWLVNETENFCKEKG